MAEEKNEQPQEPVKKKKGSFLKLIVMILLAAALLGGGFFGGMFYFKKSGAASHAGGDRKEESPVMGALWPMDPFVVNLMGNNGDRYLKAVIQLEASNPKAIETLNLLKPKLRDNVLDLLSSKTYKDLMDVSGKQRLREEIAMRLNSYLTDGEILKVYFTEFVIQ